MELERAKQSKRRSRKKTVLDDYPRVPDNVNLPTPLITVSGKRYGTMLCLYVDKETFFAQELVEDAEGDEEGVKDEQILLREYVRYLPRSARKYYNTLDVVDAVSNVKQESIHYMTH